MTPDPLIALKIEIEHRRSYISHYTIEKVVTAHVPSEGGIGGYNIVPVPVGELRRKLLAMTTAESMNAAARCLDQIDEIRDEYGAPDSEPRHPDLTSGKRWPVIIRVENTT